MCTILRLLYRADRLVCAVLKCIQRPSWVRGASCSVNLRRAPRERTAITRVRESTRRSVRTNIMHILCRQEDRMRAIRIMANL
jgi:hypothetical protein